MNGEVLKILREIKGVGMDDFSYSHQHISRVEKGGCRPTMDILMAYSKKLDMPISSIFRLSEEMGSVGNLAFRKKIINLLKRTDPFPLIEGTYV